MSTFPVPGSPSDEAAARLEAERDRVEISPAQPTGPDRIDDDQRPAPAGQSAPAHVKADRTGRMEH